MEAPFDQRLGGPAFVSVTVVPGTGSGQSRSVWVSLACVPVGVVGLLVPLLGGGSELKLCDTGGVTQRAGVWPGTHRPCLLPVPHAHGTAVLA